MRHPKSNEMMQSLKLLHTFKDGTQILAMGLVIPDGEGQFASRTVLRTLPHNEYHPFVVHTCYYDDEFDQWCFAMGDYARDLTEAVSFFDKRVSR